jgi:glucokinase
VSSLRLGLDLGGTKTAVGVVAADGSVLSRREISTIEAGDGERLLERVALLAEKACSQISVRPETVQGVGIALPGPFDPSSQRPIVVPGFPELADFPVIPYFERRWQRPARAENDANAAAMGEARYGSGAGARVVCYFTISTGIGGGVVVDGKLYRGATGQAGEFGHLKLQACGPPCRCGDRGCLEALASGTAIGRRAREAALLGAGILHELALSDPAAPTAADCAAAVRQGDPLALAVWEIAMADLGAGVATVVSLFNPDRVVLGGGVSRSADLVLPAVRRVVNTRCMPMLASAVEIVAAALGDNVGVVGAAALLDEAI